MGTRNEVESTALVKWQANINALRTAHAGENGHREAPSKGEANASGRPVSAKITWFNAGRSKCFSANASGVPQR